MTLARRAAVLAFLIIAWGVTPCLAQTAAPTTQPVLTPQEMEDFLLNAKIGASKGVSKGVTDARRVTLADGRITHDAQIQDVDIYKPIFEVGKSTELNFRDTYTARDAASILRSAFARPRGVPAIAAPPASASNSREREMAA